MADEKVEGGEKEDEVVVEAKGEEGGEDGVKVEPDWEAPSQEELANEGELVTTGEPNAPPAQPEHEMLSLGLLSVSKNSVLSI